MRALIHIGMMNSTMVTALLFSFLFARIHAAGYPSRIQMAVFSIATSSDSAKVLIASVSLKNLVKLLKVKFSKINENYKATPKELAAISQEYEQALEELGKNVQTVDIMRNYAHILAFYVFDVQNTNSCIGGLLCIQGFPVFA